MTDNVTTLPPGRTKVIEPRFRLIPFDEIRISSGGRYLVKGLLPRSGLVVVWGPPKCGKSFWATDLGLHVALGWSYRGRRVRQGPVVYCALEGAEGYGARLEAFRLRHLPDDHGAVPFFLVASPMTLVRDQSALVGAIRGTLGDVGPVAVVIDTLNRSIGGSESDDRDMAAYVAAADAIRDAFGCVVVIVHHCGIDGSRPRGHTSLTGAADAQLSVRRDAATNIVVTVEWLKDGPEGDVIVSRLEQVEVGSDDDGDPITSCLVEPVDGVAAAPASTAKTRWPKSLVFYQQALRAALAAYGNDARPYADGPIVRAVSRDHVRAEFRRIYPVDGDTDAKKTEALKKAFKRAETDALGRTLIACRDAGSEMLVWAVTE